MLIYHDAAELRIITELDFEFNDPTLTAEERAAYRTAYEEKKSCAKKLERLYQSGGARLNEHDEKMHHVTPDVWLAKKYHAMAYPNEIMQPEPGVHAFSKKLFRTQTAYFIANWYTNIRLIFVNGNNFYKLFKHSLLPRLFGIAGFSYAFELLFHMGVVLHHTFKTPGVNEETNRWHRFKQSLCKGERPSRMANAAVWFAVNFSLFWVSGGLTTVLCFAGFIFDTCHISTKSWFSIRPYQRLLTRIETEMAALKQSGMVDEASKQQLAKYEVMHGKLQAKTQSELRRKTYDTVLAATITTALMMSFFPPTAIAGMSIVLTCFGLILADSIGKKDGIVRRAGAWLWDQFIGPDPKPVLSSARKQQRCAPKQSYQRHCRPLFNNDVDIARSTEARIARRQKVHHKAPIELIDFKMPKEMRPKPLLSFFHDGGQVASARLLLDEEAMQRSRSIMCQ